MYGQLKAVIAVGRRLGYVDLYEKRVSRIVSATLLDTCSRAITINSDYAPRSLFEVARERAGPEGRNRPDCAQRAATSRGDAL